MSNPWLQIPTADYEGHMGSPEIAQLQFLARTFQETLRQYNSSSLALLGCATGNGLEYVDPQVTKQVTAVDLNPAYLEILRRRYGSAIPGLEVVAADLETCWLAPASYALIFAALIFEYVQPQVVLPKIAAWLRQEGVLVAVLQLPAKDLGKVSQSPYKSLGALEAIMNLVAPEHFKALAEAAGLSELEARIVTLASGKPFYIGAYTKG